MLISYTAADRTQRLNNNMSGEESFVILGSSPLPSLCSNGLETGKEVKPQVELNAAPREVIWAQAEAQAEVSQQSTSQQSSLPATLPSAPNSLAASFLMGDLTPDVLKNSVYSQFPSLCSMQACAEDVVKLQRMMTEYMVLKQTLDKLNNTMQDYYKITQQWRLEATKREEDYQEQLKQCRVQIDTLSEENKQLKKEVQDNLEQMRLVEDIRQKEHDELRQSVSEKSALIMNMRVEIDRLQQNQLQSFEYITDADKTNAQNVNTALNKMKSDEHEQKIKELEQKIKELERQSSRLLAENVEFQDMKKVYIDEITCLKVTLTSAEELLKATRADVHQLKALDMQKTDEIAHLKTQIEIYKRDFEMERTDREKNAGEKEQYLVDLRALQRRNQELIEALAEAHKNKQSPSTSTTTPSSSLRSNLREEQRPVRVLDPTGAAATTSESVLRCPICAKSFNALTVLQSHVNDCLDKN
ncbi:NF-kappa-B essential modulator isoform X1 [Drosophila busckii]|uniref:NF-kappa-B essential modulator isoform X1 n=1 Tax=Drosophila busckii TaxID=30019 RepID=UPI00083F5033|nr:NF-kappa-B essential modulator isoform X1 [Drosophila busckii]